MHIKNSGIYETKATYCQYLSARTGLRDSNKTMETKGNCIINTDNYPMSSLGSCRGSRLGGRGFEFEIEVLKSRSKF